MKTLAFSYIYAQRDENELEPYLDSLEKELGGIRHPYSGRKGAIDLITILEIVVTFVAGVALQPLAEKYFEGLLDGEKFESVGKQHRDKIFIWLTDLKADIAEATKTIKSLANIHTIDKFNDRDKEYAVALVFYLREIPLYVIVNHSGISAELIRSIPEGVIKAIQYAAENKLPENVRMLQLYFDKYSNRWKYLLAPTSKCIGHWIDQYIDLDTEKIYNIESRREFLEKFHPESKDELKFLINPFMDSES